MFSLSPSRSRSCSRSRSPPRQSMAYPGGGGQPQSHQDQGQSPRRPYASSSRSPHKAQPQRDSPFQSQYERRLQQSQHSPRRGNYGGPHPSPSFQASPQRNQSHPNAQGQSHSHQRQAARQQNQPFASQHPNSFVPNSHSSQPLPFTSHSMHHSSMAGPAAASGGQGMDHSQALQQSGESQQQQQQPLFRCSADSTKTLSTIISTIEFRKDQLAVVAVSASGIKLTSTEDNGLQAKAYLKKELFDVFMLNSDDEIKFTLNVTLLLHCFRVFGENSHLIMSYATEGAPICLVLEDSGLITQCELRTIDGEPEVDFNFHRSRVVTRAIFRSRFLKEAFAELDIPGGKAVTIRMAHEEPAFMMKVDGDAGNFQVNFPNEKEIFNVFECHAVNEHSYALKKLSRCCRAIAKATQVNLRMNELGMISMQFVIPSTHIDYEEGAAADRNWVDFVYFPLEMEGNLAEDEFD